MANPRDKYLLKRGRSIGKSGQARKAGSSFSISWEETEDVPMPDFDAVALAVVVRDAILEANRAAILAGKRADNGQPHPPLDPKGTQGKQAAKGKRPNVRGHTRGQNRGRRTLPDHILGTRIMGNSAKATFDVVLALPQHAAYVAREAAQGTELLTVPQKEIDAAVEFWTTVAMAGRIPSFEMGEKLSKDVK